MEGESRPVWQKLREWPKRRMLSLGAASAVLLTAAAALFLYNKPWTAGPRSGRAVQGNAPSLAAAPFNADRARAHQEVWAKHLGVPVEFENSIGMKLVLIPPGKFLMGSTSEEIETALQLASEDAFSQECIESEAPQHKAELTRPFYLSVHEVTQAQYERVMSHNPSHFAATGPGREAVAGLDTSKHPVEQASWHDAAEFCTKLSRAESLQPFDLREGDTIAISDGNGYRLPTEAEWEFACRAGTATRFWSGDDDEQLSGVAWFDSNADGRTHAVGELNAVNAWGLADIHGNVWEWVLDGWEPSFYGQFQKQPARDPHSPVSAGSQGVLRGGGWSFNASSCRSSARLADDPLFRRSNVGFRVALPVSDAQRGR